MKRSTRSIARGAAVVTAVLAVGAPVANAGGAGDPVKVVASGLEGPFGIDAHGGRVYVAEAGDSQVSEVTLDTGRVRPVVTGLTSPSDVARVGDKLVIVTGGPDEPPTDTTADAGVFVARPGGSPRLLVDLEAYELEHNTDGQLQFDPETGAPLDSLSNPFAVIGQRGPGYVLVADAGANAVLSVSRSGDVTPFFVPEIVNTGACEGLPNNDPEHTGCDPVPTGLAYGPGNTLYVSTLQSEVPGEGRVYVLDARTGRVRRVISGFTAPTGVAVAPDGTVYVSELLHNAPEGEPPPDFDPSTVGRIVRVARDGSRTFAGVTMPVGLDFQGGSLYSTAWSVAGIFLGIPEAGQVVRVGGSAFG